MTMPRKTTARKIKPLPEMPKDVCQNSIGVGDSDLFAPNNDDPFSLVEPDPNGADPFRQGIGSCRDDFSDPLDFDTQDWCSDDQVLGLTAKRNAEDELARSAFTAALEKFRNPYPLVGSVTVSSLAKIGMERLLIQIAAGSCLGNLQAEVADCQVMADEYRPALISCGKAIRIQSANSFCFRLGLGISMDGGLFFLSAEDFDPFFLVAPPVPLPNVAAYFELLAATVAGIQKEFGDRAATECQQVSALRSTPVLRKTLARARSFFKR